MRTELRERQILDPAVSLHLINYPTGRYLRKVGLARDLLSAIRALQPDVVHYQSAADPWVPLAMSRLRRFPLVATIHDASAHPDGWAAYVIQAAKNLFVTRLAHQVIVHGQQQADILIQRCHALPDTVNVIPLGPYEMFKVLASGQITQDGRVVLFFGQLRPHKGIDVLIRAAPLIAARMPDVRIVIAGSGECPAIHRAAAEHPEWFEVHNYFIKAEEVHRHFRRAALVVQPYLEASQSGVLPVAYMFGRPVVASRVGSIPEVVDDGETGYLVEPGDERALAQAVIRLLEDAPLREAMGKAARAKVERDLSWNGIAEKTLAVYERAQAQSGTGRIARDGAVA